MDIQSRKRGEKFILEVLLKALSIVNEFWNITSREDLLKFFIKKIYELDVCSEIVVIDKQLGKYYVVGSDTVAKLCRYFEVGDFRFVDALNCECETPQHRYLLIFPYDDTSAIYFFIKDVDEEFSPVICTALHNLSHSMATALKIIECQNKKREVIKKLEESLSYFERISDKLRNSVTVLLALTELGGEINPDRMLNMTLNCVEKLKDVVNDLLRCESEIKKISKNISMI